MTPPFIFLKSSLLQGTTNPDICHMFSYSIVLNKRSIVHFCEWGVDARVGKGPDNYMIPNIKSYIDKKVTF